MTGYYDLVLGLIPLAMGGIAAALTIAGFQLTTAITLASVVAVGLIGHALFVNGPVDSPSQSAASGVSETANEPFQTAD